MSDPNAAPTVRIVYPANLRAGYCQIPASEYDPEIHTLWREAGEQGISEDAAQTGEGSAFASMSDAELRAFIKAKTGKPAPSRITHENLIQMAESL